MQSYFQLVRVALNLQKPRVKNVVDRLNPNYLGALAPCEERKVKFRAPPLAIALFRQHNIYASISMLQCSQLFAQIHSDPWRSEIPFSDDIAEANEKIFSAGGDKNIISSVLNDWIMKRQPCIFGRMSAQAGQISYCILTDNDLKQSDDYISGLIQEERLRWLHHANFGRRSAFVILAVSKVLAEARPDEEMLEFAKRLAFLYLLKDVEQDKVLLDEIFLEKHGQEPVVWKWDVGANYFAAHGDGRWWRDHRIPGGIGFSMNSVGHLVKSTILGNSSRAAEQALGAPPEEWSESKTVDSLGQALVYAMKTISNATPTPSGRATELLPLPEDRTEMPVKECPFKLPPSLQSENFCAYRGYYHTDYTIPSEYFRPDVDRPDLSPSYSLDFTYLFHKEIDNPAHTTMGLGRRVRAGDDEISEAHADLALKDAKANETEVSIESRPLLKRALELYRV